MTTPFIAWLADLSNDDVAKVGGKNASLGEMVRELRSAGIRVPDGFALTADAYRAHLEGARLRGPMSDCLAAFAAGRASLHDSGRALRRLIRGAPLPEAVRASLVAAYRELGARTGRSHPSVAVRSSATAEDLPEASFAGQQETYLNIEGEVDLIEATRNCLASLFTDRAIAYREAQHIDHMQVALSVGVQLMVRSDLGGAGVMFTLDPETGFPDVVMINAVFGLGENAVKGTVNPDEYVVWKPGLTDLAKRPILHKKVGSKEQMMVLARAVHTTTKNVRTPAARRRALVLDDDEVLTLARWGVLIEAHYSARAGHAMPMDIEWAKDGVSGELFIVQARPETVRSREERNPSGLVTWVLEREGAPLAYGRSVGTAIAAGPVSVVHDVAHIGHFVPGSILVAETTDPDWVPIMKQAAGIVTDHGGRTCHAAIVARELGIPAVVGTGDGSEKLMSGAEVTLSCAGGEQGVVYAGRLPFRKEVVDVSDLPHTRTHIMMNLGDPGAAFGWWRLPVDGIGLARMEFIIANEVRVHPMALVHPERVGDAAARKAIAALCGDWADPKDYFVQTLARGVARLAAAQWPKPVIVRMSDFKSNEYARLLGGESFEPHEENPMIGFRGASRYADERYRDGFRLECRAMKQVREVIGLANVILMIPFCRTLDEADRVLAVMAEEGLKRGDNGLEVYVMCEIPANVVLAREFAERFDGFSIGSNDLTQLVLGADRDSELLAGTFDERNPAVVALIREAIAKAHAAGRHIGICGQGPSDHPDFAETLVRAGIDSMSLDPTTVVATRRRVAAIEGGL